MTIMLMLALLAVGEDTVDPSIKIWEEIAGLEVFVNEAIADDYNSFAIFKSDPIHGYYVPRIGVVLLIPVHYRLRPTPIAAETKGLPTGASGFSLPNREEIQEKISVLREQVRKSEILKDANFDRLVTSLRSRIPEILEHLNALADGESLTLIIEERVPAWYYAGFSLKKDPTRKVVTLTVGKDLISEIHANKTVLDAEMLKRIKQTTTYRRLISVFP